MLHAILFALNPPSYVFITLVYASSRSKGRWFCVGRPHVQEKKVYIRYQDEGKTKQIEENKKNKNEQRLQGEKESWLMKQDQRVTQRVP